jgi:uncharacterized Zn-binding protein involved in type VI secretion
MYIEYAAHVDHGVYHTSDTAKITLGLLAAGIAVFIVATGGAGAVAVIGAAGTAGSLGMDLGKIIDGYSPKNIEEHIASGLDSVRLGGQRKPAARAFTDSKLTDHGGDNVEEGSENVMLGVQRTPMARRQDRTSCGGTIAEGVKSILVGGNPSKQGRPIEEKEGDAAVFFNWSFGMMSAGKNLMKKQFIKGTWDGVATTAGALGHGELESVMKLGSAGKPSALKGKNALDRASQLNRYQKGGETLVDLGADLVAPNE